MSLSFNLQFSVAPFPTGFSGDLNAYATQLVANLSATITGNFLTGQVGGTAPTSNIGPWANGNTWWFWNASLTVPAYQSEFTTLQRNYNSLINGDHQILQRLASGKTGVGAAAGYFGTDRWKYTGSMATGLATITQQTSGITGGQFVNTSNQNIEYCYRVTVTTPQASLAAGDHFDISQYVEQQLARPLFNIPTSLSIGLRVSITGTFCTSIVDQALGQSYIMDCVIASANTWQLYQFPNIAAFPGGANFGATDIAAAYLVRICAASGTTFNAGTNGAWSAANNIADSSQTNLFATNGATLDFTIIQHEPGSVCTPFIFVPFDQSLRACQRYFYKSYRYVDYPAAASAIGPIRFYAGNGNATFGTLRYPVKMRAAPTVVTYSDVTGTINKIRDVIGAADTVSSTITGTEDGLNQVNGSAITAGASGYTGSASFHITADQDF
jgi:hypothetical protein